MGIKISKKNMVELADKIFERLELQAHITEEDEEEEEKKETVVKDMKTELQHFIESSLATSDVVPVAKSFDGDFKLYDSQKQRTKKMTLLFNAVLTIKPTSVEAERTFSTSGNCATKIRSRLGNRRVNPTANGRHLKRASRRNGDNYSYLFAYMPIGICDL